MNYVLVLGLVCCILKFCQCFPHNSPIISKYARVAVWGKNQTNLTSAARSINNGNIWNHRFDSGGDSKNPSVVYQYPVYQKPSSKPEKKIEHVPGIGEVIVAEAQDRFEARPHFSSKGGISSTYLPPAQSNPATYLPPSTASVPVAPRPSQSLYDSPYNSYNPPVFKPDSYSPNNYPPHGNSDENFSPPESSKQPSKSKPTANSYVSLGPPVAPHDDYDHPGHNDDDNNDDHQEEEDHPMHDDHDDFEPHDFHKDIPQDPMAMYKNQDGPPEHPPKSFDDVYYPPDFPKEQIPKKQAGGMHGMQEMPPDDHDDMPPDDHDDMPPDDHDHDMMPPDNHDMMPPEDMDDEPKSMGPPDHMEPPPHEYEAEHGHAFPQYLYDHHHYNEHVYEEIPHTMAPAKEDKRVSSTHYSYYYLGRKLWYIPLYFSIYFIIYVTVLIVKSIARHKVKLKYKWYEHDHDDAKQARSLNLDDARREEVDNIHRNVSVALTNATAKYDKVMAMK